MRRPRDIDDLAQCVKLKGETLWVFCVECDEWRQAALSGTAEVTMLQSRAKNIDYNTKWWAVCAKCGVEIEYLLSPGQMDHLKLMCGVK